MNDNAELYQNNNTLQRRDAMQCLENYLEKIKWKKHDDKIIDIGCGDGGVLNIIKNYIPIEFGEILGSDISEKMIHHANLHHQDKRTKFMVLDIEGKLPEQLRENFDHAFSFYALHWVKDQETAFRNIYDLLNENGDCLLAFLAQTPIYDVFRILSKNNKWSAVLRDLERFVSPYHNSQDPENEVKKLLEKVGFTDIYVKNERKQYVYENLDVWRKAIEAINPFNIPADLADDFMKDFLRTVFEKGLLLQEGDDIFNKNSKVRFDYSLLVIYANKKCLKGK